MNFEEFKLLNNGNKIPTLGFGTDYIPKGELTVNAVVNAIKIGYRHIDNADCYDNQKDVGIAIKQCIDEGTVTRQDLFVVSKVPDWKQGWQSTIDCCENSLKEMGLEYFDLYLVHSPLRGCSDWQCRILETYKALEFLYNQGRIKNIGVANFNRRHLMFLRSQVNILPVVNQFELHCEHQQRDVVDVCSKSYILPIGWGTLNQGRIYNNKTILDIAAKYEVNPSQIAVRWSVQKGYCPLARSINPEHIKTNFNIANFEISPEDMQILDSLDGGAWSHTHDDSLISQNSSKQNSQTKYKLFGFIPILKKVKESNRITRWYLFGLQILKVDSKQ